MSDDIQALVREIAELSRRRDAKDGFIFDGQRRFDQWSTVRQEYLRDVDALDLTRAEHNNMSWELAKIAFQTAVVECHVVETELIQACRRLAALVEST